jgi:EAL and modified HD-GYP domain-containing signal transduction protein
MEAFVGRQPIFDAKQDLVGYELLFRSGAQADRAAVTDPRAATMDVISTSFVSMGLDRVLGGQRGFINFDRDLLMSQWATMLPPDKVVLEILESVGPDPLLMRRLEELRELGYTLALDDYAGDAALDQLLGAVDIVKVDFLLAPATARREIAARLAGSNLILLAEKVEDKVVFAEAREIGYSWFQGYFFARPSLLTRKTLPPVRLVALQLLEELRYAAMSFTRVEHLIRQDVGASHSLLRYINSAAFALGTPVTSIARAIALVGEAGMKKWIAMATIKRLGRGKPAALIGHALFRARFCEIIAEEAGLRNPGEAFLLGILSVLDGLLERPLDEALAGLAISDTMRKALLEPECHDSDLSRIFCLTRSYEDGDWEGILRLAGKLAIKPAKMPESYVSAIEWAEQLQAQQV